MWILHWRVTTCSSFLLWYLDQEHVVHMCAMLKRNERRLKWSVLKLKMTHKFPLGRCFKVGTNSVYRNNTWSKPEHDGTFSGRRGLKGRRRGRDVPVRERGRVRERATMRGGSLDQRSTFRERPNPWAAVLRSLRPIHRTMKLLQGAGDFTLHDLVQHSIHVKDHGRVSWVT